jgi:hypothetical protein
MWPIDRFSEFFYEKVIKVKADVAALLIFLVLCGFRHISAETFALGALRSDDWQLCRPTHSSFCLFPAARRIRSSQPSAGADKGTVREPYF